VLPLLIVLLLGIIDFGLYYYNDLQLTHVARDAARYLSVNNIAGADAAISGATLVSTSIDSRGMSPATSGQPATVTLHATYSFLTPLPAIVGIGRTLGINASVVMRRE
jgi:Flp pilus assembly protein TadG